MAFPLLVQLALGVAAPEAPNGDRVAPERVPTNLYGQTPREDSAEADLFKLLIRDLSTGGVIRQERDVNQLGQFVRKDRSARASCVSTHHDGVGI